MAGNKVLMLAVMVVMLRQDVSGWERRYNVPKELEIAFMSARGRYTDFQGIDCSQPPELKTICKDIPLVVRWHWNHETKTCERVAYYGCEPSRNNFNSLVQCLNTAGPICRGIENDRYKYYQY